MLLIAFKKFESLVNNKVTRLYCLFLAIDGHLGRLLQCSFQFVCLSAETQSNSLYCRITIDEFVRRATFGCCQLCRRFVNECFMILMTYVNEYALCKCAILF